MIIKQMLYCSVKTIPVQYVRMLSFFFNTCTMKSMKNYMKGV